MTATRAGRRTGSGATGRWPDPGGRRCRRRERRTQLRVGPGDQQPAGRLGGQGPATITPTSEDLEDSLNNFNLTSIVVTREAVGTASLEARFDRPATTFFFWERGSASSPTTANGDLLVEALDLFGRVIAVAQLLRTEYAPTGIAVTTWNGSFASPSAPGGDPPPLGSAGLSLDVLTTRLPLTSVQQAATPSVTRPAPRDRRHQRPARRADSDVGA